MNGHLVRDAEENGNGQGVRYQQGEGVLNLPPIRLETLLHPSYKEKAKSGYHVPIPVQNSYEIS